MGLNSCSSNLPEDRIELLVPVAVIEAEALLDKVAKPSWSAKLDSTKRWVAQAAMQAGTCHSEPG